MLISAGHPPLLSMDTIEIYRGVTGTEAVIVKGLGPKELGDRWTTDPANAEGYAKRRGGGVFRMAVHPSRCEKTRTPDIYRVRVEDLTPGELATLDYIGINNPQQSL